MVPLRVEIAWGHTDPHADRSAPVAQAEAFIGRRETAGKPRQAARKNLDIVVERMTLDQIAEAIDKVENFTRE